MNAKTFSTLILSAMSAFTAFAQPKGKTAVKGIYVPCRFSSQPRAYGGWLVRKDQKFWSSGMDKKMVAEVLAGCDSTQWPVALRTDEYRIPNLRNLSKYTMYLVARYATPGNDYSLVQIPAAANSAMPVELRPSKNIYLLVRSWNVSTDRTYNPDIDGKILPYFSPDGFYPGKRIHCRIIDRGELYSTYDLNDDSTWKVYVEDYEVEDILSYSTEDNWPEKLATIDQRGKYESYFKYFHAYVVAELNESSGKKYIVELPSYENEHMPDGLRPDNNIYMVFGEAGLDLEDFYDEDIDGYPEPIEEEGDEETPPVAPDPVEPEPAVETPSYSAVITPGKPVKCYIIDRGSMYSSMDITEYETELTPYLTKPFEYVKKYCKEDNWPEGINTLDERENLNKEFKKYSVKAIAKFGGFYYLLEVNPEDNAHMPADMRPDKTIYFIIGPGGLSATAPAE